MSDALTSEERLDSAEYRISEIERQFKEAFPNGDHQGHCRYHEIQIEDLLAKRQLLVALKEKTLSGLLWAGIVVMGLAMWKWIKAQAGITT